MLEGNTRRKQTVLSVLQFNDILSQSPPSSHYCRRDTKKTYIDGKLNMTILYEKYVEDCKLRNEEPAKIHLYREVFNHEYNIDFVKPKKDRCDMCERKKLLTVSGPEEDEQLRFSQHIRGKTEAHNERNKDRSNSNQCTGDVLCSGLFNLPPGSICVLLFVISWRYRLTASARIVVGLSQLPARRRGTHCQQTFVLWTTAPLDLDDYLRLICFLSTSAYSALGVSTIMRYINRRFTDLLTADLGLGTSTLSSFQDSS